MKTLAVLALLLVLGNSSVRAQQSQPAPPADGRHIQLELLMLEQDVDRTLLREAMLILGRREIRPLSERPSGEGAKNREEADVAHLKNFIETRKEAIAARSETMNKISQPIPRRNQAVVQDKQALITKYSDAQVESQLLTRKSQLFQQSLNEAIEVLANAELAASTDESKKKDVDAASKQFERAKSNYIEISKKLLSVQTDIIEMQQQGVMGGMLGMGGMGGGFR